jgi:dUTPase
MRIRIQQLDPDLKVPARANPGDAGYDLYARIDVRVPPAGGRVAVPTGIANGLPVGVQIIGPRFREDLCLAAAEAIEARVPRLTPIDPRH